MRTIKVSYDLLHEMLRRTSRQCPLPISYDISCDSFVFSQDAYDAWLRSIGEKAPKPPTEEPYKHCECGSEAVGSSQHSTWCPKFENST